MKQARYLFALLLLCALSWLNADSNSFFSLISPTGLEALQSELSIQHRFRGPVDEDVWDTFFGTNRGANVALFYRQALLKQAELKFGYIKENTEYTAEASWSFLPGDYPVRAQINLQYFSYEDFFDPEERHNNVLIALALENKPLYDRFSLNLNLGYDAENERLVNGIGARIMILPSLSWLTEYYPVWDRDSAPQEVQNQIRKRDSFSTGIKLDTYGHQFLLMVGNNEAMNPRASSLGSFTRDLKFGFNIQRRFAFFNL